MKLGIKISLSICLAVSMFLTVNYVFAAKPLDVIELSNGYPSGSHYNLNIHGKENYTCDATEGGNSVFISENGDSTISYVTNRKSSISELTVLDKCAEDFDGDSATVQIPFESSGYYVFATVKGKPNNGTGGSDSGVLLYPNLVREACNDTDAVNPDFPTYTECPDDPELALGLIVGNNIYEATNAGLVRLNTSGTGGKGKSKATDITNLFRWTGYVFDATLDTNGPEGLPDGIIDYWDVPIEYNLEINGGNENGIIDESEFLTWADAKVDEGYASYYENEWILNIADLVVTDQAISNDGTKLLKIRFYPVETTEFISQYD